MKNKTIAVVKRVVRVLLFATSLTLYKLIESPWSGFFFGVVLCAYVIELYRGVK